MRPSPIRTAPAGFPILIMHSLTHLYNNPFCGFGPVSQDQEKAPNLEKNLQWAEDREQRLVVGFEKGWSRWNGIYMNQRIAINIGMQGRL